MTNNICRFLYVSNVSRALQCTLVLATLCVKLAPAQYLGGSPQQQVSITQPVNGEKDVIQELLNAKRPTITIEPGDEVSVEVFEIEHYSYKLRVETDGTISLPLIDTVELQGLSPEEAEHRIAAKLDADGMVRNAHLHVALTQEPTEQYTVAGDVQKPGLFSAYGPHTLLGAVAEAGGLKEDASGNVTLLRPGAVEGFTFSLGPDPAKSPAANIPIFRGDTVIVGAAGVIYVVGAVLKSGVYKLKPFSATTVSQALAEAGNVGYEGERNHVSVIRNVDGKRVEMTQAASTPQEQNLMVLQPDDIVFVPTSTMRAALKGGAASVAAVLASSALYRF